MPLVATWLLAQADQPDQISFGKLFGAVALVVGFLAAVHQLSKAYRRRRFDKAEERVLEIVAQEIDAEAVKRDAAKYEALRLTLRRQVEEEVPKEAQRVYLRSRVETLRAQLESDLEEYERVSAELQAIADDASVPELDERLRQVIEASIRPVYVRRRQNERLILAVLIGLVLLPLTPVAAAFEVIPDFFEIIGDPGHALPSEVVPAAALAIGAIAVPIVLIVRWLSSHGVRWAVPSRWTLGSAAVLTLAGAALLLAAEVENLSGEASFERATRAEIRRLEIENAHPRDRRPVDAAETEELEKRERAWNEEGDRHYSRVALLVKTGLPVTGVALGLLLGLMSIRWRVPRRR